jgi:uncharacterized heparinase superfamily protein
VNPGTSTYAIDVRRATERSTLLHNTVTLDEANSSEVWESFRIGRRARVKPLLLDWKARKACYEHDGYRFLRGGPKHRRTLQLGSGSLLLVDEIISDSDHDCISRFHLAPEIAVDLEDETKVRLTGPFGTARFVVRDGKWRVEKYDYALGLGKRQICYVLQARWLSKRHKLEMKLIW